MSVQLFAVIVDCQAPGAVSGVLGGVVGWRTSRRDEGEFQISDPAGGPILLYFMAVPEPKSVKNRLHLDLITDGSISQGRVRLNDEVEMVLACHRLLTAVTGRSSGSSSAGSPAFPTSCWGRRCGCCADDRRNR